MQQALSDLKILDITHYVGGPYCTKLLADYGAEVIKIEKPGNGDGARRIGPFHKDEPHAEKSGLFLHLNTNKKGIALNLKTTTGVKLLKEMRKRGLSVRNTSRGLSETEYSIRPCQTIARSLTASRGLQYSVNDNIFHLEVEVKLTERKVLATLKRYGYKLTPQRRVVIGTITSSRDHLTPADIYKQVHFDHPNIGLVTVYRTLGILTKLGLICELHAGGSCQSYTISTLQHHHHLICSNCGMVVDFTGHNVAELEDRLSRESGFRIDDHRLEFSGLCKACQ